MGKNALLEVANESVDVRRGVAGNWAGEGTSDEGWDSEERGLHDDCLVVICGWR